MRPLIPPGSRVQIGPLIGPLHTGDIVLAARHERLLIHRVVRLGPPVQLCGDNNRRPDVPIPRADLLGRAVAITTPGGWIMRLDRPLVPGLGRLWLPIFAARRRLRAALTRPRVSGSAPHASARSPGRAGPIRTKIQLTAVTKGLFF